MAKNGTKTAEVEKTAEAEVHIQPPPEAESKQALVASQDPADMMEQYSGEGLEDVKASDLALPQFKLLQSGSPQVKRAEADYVKGAREGIWLDVISRRLFSELTFIPCKYATYYVEWTLETLGKLIANHGTDRSLYDQCKRDETTGSDITPSGKSVVVPTATWYGLVVGGVEINPSSPEDPGVRVDMQAQAVITMAGTGMRVSRRWVSDANSLQLKAKAGHFFHPPLFAMSYILGSSGTKNDRGSWFLPTVARGGWTLDYPHGGQLFEAARAFSKFATEMRDQLIVVNKDDSPLQDGGGNGGGETRSRGPSTPRIADQDNPDEDIPF